MSVLLLPPSSDAIIYTVWISSLLPHNRHYLCCITCFIYLCRLIKINYINITQMTANEQKGLIGPCQTDNDHAAVLCPVFSKPWEMVNKMATSRQGLRTKLRYTSQVTYESDRLRRISLQTPVNCHAASHGTSALCPQNVQVLSAAYPRSQLNNRSPIGEESQRFPGHLEQYCTPV